MAENRGKQFEGVIREAFEKVPNTTITRLPDPTQGYLGIRNICDFIIYHYPNQYFIECKSVHGNTLSIHSNDPKKRYGAITNNQWEGMLEVSKVEGVVAGIICWWIDHDVTKFIDIEYLYSLRTQGHKSIRLDITSENTPPNYADDYELVDIHGKKKRVFFDYDMQKFFEEVAYEKGN